MPKYFPLESAPVIEPADLSDCFGVTWKGHVLEALFRIPSSDDHAVELRFGDIHRPGSIVRMLDEMPLCTEAKTSPIEWAGSFKWAVRAEDALFWQTQSKSFKMMFRDLKHYRFITGWTCLDVITNDEPAFRTVSYNYDAYLNGDNRLRS